MNDTIAFLKRHRLVVLILCIGGFFLLGLGGWFGVQAYRWLRTGSNGQTTSYRMAKRNLSSPVLKSNLVQFAETVFREYKDEAEGSVDGMIRVPRDRVDTYFRDIAERGIFSHLLVHASEPKCVWLVWWSGNDGCVVTVRMEPKHSPTRTPKQSFDDRVELR
jgi:hypothetical protein